MIDMDAVSEIKSRLNIEDVVSEYVQLKRAGRNFKGLSPFTNERTPSFVVSPDKQIWHDFSSGKGGDVISFIEAVEGLDFKGALELLARKAGVDLQAFSGSSTSSNTKLKERLYAAVEAAVSFYQLQLTKHEAPLRYVRIERGYEKQTLLDFRFGYAPSSGHALADYLRSKNFTQDELVKAGLCVQRGSDTIDMFRNRLMIPLSDTQGRPVGFTARQLDSDRNAPKYINTPATLLYDKSRQLFGFSQAKEYIRKTGYVVVVEGNLDVVASHQAGVKQVVASAGTALTLHHLKALARFTGDIRLAFDDDRAGQEAAERTIPLAQSLGLELSFIKIPAGKDPDELIKKDVSAWQKTVDTPVYMIDWLLERHAAAVDMTSAQGKRQFSTKIFEIVRKIPDTVEQEHYLRIVADMTKTSLDTVTKKFAQDTQATTPRLKKVRTSGEVDPQIDASRLILEQHFLAITTTVTEFNALLAAIPLQVFTEQAAVFVRHSISAEKVQKTDEYAKMLALLFEETYQHTELQELAYQAKQLARRLVDTYIRHKKTMILQQLEEANEEQEQLLLQEVHDLEKIKKAVYEAADY
jgi:DNA primase